MCLSLTPQVVQTLKSLAHKFSDYFEASRRKRNIIDCTLLNVATDTAMEEILAEAAAFYKPS